MTNEAIADTFSFLSKLMDINRENSFKAKTYAIAAYPFELSNTTSEIIFSTKGIGESTGKKIIELLETNTLQILQDLIATTPNGVVEMLQIKGIGPKKISTIWKEMEIESIGELLYACQENRLKLYKGFGDKTQQNIIETIEFYLNNQGHYLYAQLEAIVPQITTYLTKLFLEENVLLTGAFLEQQVTIEELAYVIAAELPTIKNKLQSAFPPQIIEENETDILVKLTNGLKLRLYSETENLHKKQFFTTGSKAFTTAFHKKFTNIDYKNKSDVEIFKQAGIAYIPTYAREDADIDLLANKAANTTVITQADIKGIVHSHSNWSDGSNTIEEMALAAAANGFEYLVMSDHSKSAFYAQGLSEEKIAEQHHYINQLNDKYPAFKIFKSIESDILNDGSLDYSNAILATFDLVIASVHSNLKMTEDKAMMRLLKAIENPYTTILGHLTGRLLLSRKGYPIDHKKIIDACAANNVAIELNAHPRRLDIDWSYIDYAIKKNVLISINPDAHAIEGFNDIKYGVLAAQKALLTKEQNLSSKNLADFTQYLVEVKKKRGIE
jgi:DNA polymerase (family X)